jgi:glycine cleavage system aminomethyltransferase T
MEMPRAQSALHEIYRQRGAKWQESDLAQVPGAFTTADAEVEASQTAVGIGERGDAGVLEVEGEALPQFAGRLGIGEVAAGAAADLTLAGEAHARWCRLTRSRARILIRGENRRAVRAGLEMPDACLHVSDLSSALTTLVILGPRSPDLLARVMRIDVDPRAFGDRSLVLTGAVGIPVQLLRWDCGTVLCYELTVGRDVAAYCWDALTHSGEGLGLSPVGAEALARLSNT